MELSGGTAAAKLVKNNASSVTSNLNSVPGFITAVQPGGSNPTGNTPQAYLTILFFDERFNFIAAADGGVAQQQVAASVTADGSTLVQNDIKAPKNGYAYVYISNQSNLDVFFDNLKVQIVTGNIIEENHYYSYGLKIAAISSKKLGDTYEGTLKNSYLYNDKELFEDGGLNWYDYGFRNYDPQIGRFTQLDPLTDDYPFLTPYQYASCEPIANVDLDGLEAIGSTVASSTGPAIVSGSSFLQPVIITSKSVATGTKALTVGLKAGLQFANSYKNIVSESVCQGCNVNLAAQQELKTTGERNAKIKQLKKEFDQERIRQDNIREGLWDPDLSDDEAKRNLVGLGVDVVVLNPLLKSATTTANVAKRGITVLGKIGEYEAKATKLGANKFVLENGKYIWEANKKFLNDAITRGDDFIFSSSYREATGTFAREIKYLIEEAKILGKGYKAAEDGLSFIKL